MHRTDSNMRGSRKFSQGWSNFRPGSVGQSCTISKPIPWKIEGSKPLSAHEQELHRVDAQLTIENTFNNRLCVTNAGQKTEMKILPFVTDFVRDL